MTSQASIVSPVGYSASTCGYCSTPGKRSQTKSSCSYGLWAHDISPSHYQSLCDQGWRRSGRYIYKPDLQRTCCKQITIRLDAQAFIPSSSHKRTIKRVLRQLSADGTEKDEAKFRQVWGKGKGKGKYTQSLSLDAVFEVIAGKGTESEGSSGSSRSSINSLHKERQAQAETLRKARKESKKATDSGFLDSVPRPHTLQGKKLAQTLSTRLVPGTGSDEKYTLFRKYQMKIHQESAEDVSNKKGFERFLCDSSVRREITNAGKRPTDSLGKPLTFGLYHMEWYLCDLESCAKSSDSATRNKLVAVGVLDVLPSCVSSVYLFYDPDYGHLDLGKLSALREIQLTQELYRSGAIAQSLYYMGFYIHNCAKMRYKGSYRPSELLDTLGYRWVQLSSVVSDLEKGKAYGWTAQGQGDAVIAAPGRMVDGAANTSSERWLDGDDDDDGDDLLPKPVPPGIESVSKLNEPRIARLMVLEADNQAKGVLPFALTDLYNDPGREHDRAQLLDCVAAVGSKLAEEMIFFL